jgi:acyl-CoA hydrolase
MKNAKKVADSISYSSEMILPNDTNAINNLMGGHLMRMIDLIGGITGQKHSNRLVATASLDNMSFDKSISMGNVITLEAKVTRAFRTSMEVMVNVFSENIPKGTKEKTNSAFLTYVAIDENARPVEVPDLIPETDEEKELYAGALRRRQLRLVLAERMKPQDANELKSIFGL